jgi:hypothetical protein
MTFELADLNPVTLRHKKEVSLELRIRVRLSTISRLPDRRSLRTLVANNLGQLPNLLGR